VAVGLAGDRYARADLADPRRTVPNAVIAHEPSGKFDLAALKKARWPGLIGMNLVPMVTSRQRCLG
jgi:carbamoyl-phosphate synthase small subunit